MPNQIQNPKDRKDYNLEERTAKFGEAVIGYARALESSQVNHPLVSQVVRSSTSIGANYMEADGAESKKDFGHKIAICKKEAKETMHWFRMLAAANPSQKNVCRKFWQEAHELALIFSAIVRSTSKS